MKRIPIAVVGFGRFGRLHALRLRDHPRFQLRCVVDPSAEARSHAAAMGFAAVCHLTELPSEVSAAAVTTPPESHADVASALLRRGIHVLVEKPLATCEADIERLLSVARETGQVLCTGHLERFNAKPVRIGQGSMVEFHRVSCGSYDGRHAVLDLLVHDLDLIAYWLDLPGHEEIQITAGRLCEREIEATCLLMGVPVRLHAAYGAPASQASVVCGAASPVADTLARSPWLAKLSTLFGQDALMRQYSAFCDRLHGLDSPIADGVAGSAAARRALAILRAL